MYVTQRYNSGSPIVRLRGLGRLGSADTVQQGFTYVFSFQSVGLGKPTDAALMSRIRAVGSLLVRRIEWNAGLFGSGLFGDTLQVTITWNGTAPMPTEQLGSAMATAMSKGFIGTFAFQGATEGIPPTADQVGIPTPPSNNKGIPWGWVTVGGIGVVGLALVLKG